MGYWGLVGGCWGSGGSHVARAGVQRTESCCRVSAGCGSLGMAAPVSNHLMPGERAGEGLLWFPAKHGVGVGGQKTQ